MPNKEDIKVLLSDLGRATLRGVRRCPKCGTYNGTRGLSCKNKACDVVFKEAGEKRKFSTDACRLHTGSNTQVFSVRVRDKGPDYRGFVQLLTEADPLTAGVSTPDEDLPNAALCFVDTCQHAFDASVLKCHEKNSFVPPTPPISCQHIAAALRCYTEAHPLTLKAPIINQLNCDINTKQALWSLVAETSGPLVQRVSKTIMAVKCKPSPKHPLGYLHFAFLTSRLKDRVDYRHFCSCPEFKGHGKDDANTFKRCAHFYACVGAFASDEKLSEEFAHYVDMCCAPPTPSREERQLFSILNETLGVGVDSGGHSCDVKVVLQDEPLLQSASISVAEDGTITQVHELGDIQIHPLDADGITYSTADIVDILPKIDSAIPQLQVKLKRKRDDSGNEVLVASEGTAEGSSHILCNPKTRNIGGAVRGTGSQRQTAPERKSVTNTAFKKQDPPDENNSNLSFIQWLASVTERINQTMHFQFSGDPDPLVFHVPQVFFDCLRERMSTPHGLNKKKRLPNTTSAFVRKDSVPLGIFTKYTWRITSVLFVKRIFDTALMPLEIIRSFVENKDGTYTLFQNKKATSLLKESKWPPIKPLEFRTYLKVGNTSPDQAEPTPFIIEWIPDVLPLSRVGELRLQFKFGHQHCGSEKTKASFLRQVKPLPKSKRKPTKPKKLNVPFYNEQQPTTISVLVNPEELLELS